MDAPLHQADIVTLQFCLMSQSLLGEPCFDTTSAQDLSERQFDFHRCPPKGRTIWAAPLQVFTVYCEFGKT